MTLSEADRQLSNQDPPHRTRWARRASDPWGVTRPATATRRFHPAIGQEVGLIPIKQPIWMGMLALLKRSRPSWYP